MLDTTAETHKDEINNKEFKKFFKQFRDVTKKPYEFLRVQTERAEKIKILIKDLYAYNIRNDGGNRDPEILPDIILEGMDEEQIWQQIELRNNLVWPQLLEATSKISSKEKDFIINLNETKSEKIAEDSDEENVSEVSGAEDYFKDAEDMSDEDYSDEESSFRESEKKRKKQHKKTIVDDKFFKLREMEEFLNAEDEKERIKSKGKGLDESGIDYFNQNLSDEEEENANYKDFFDDDDIEDEDTRENGGAMDNEVDEERQEEEFDEEDDLDEEENLGEEEFEGEDMYESDNKLNDENESEEDIDDKSDEERDEDNNSENKVKSSFEMRQERLKRRIEEYEEQVLGEKPWQLKGEIEASGRPQNSLLEEVLEFDSTTRPAPIVTEETTLRLEDIIKQRIKDKAWDDVERKVKPIQTPQQFRKTLTLDQEKSKESLAQIYEKQYQKELEKLDPNREENEEEPKTHKEIKDLMKSLFNKLDALSNFHYTPKPVAPEARIITNTPAVTMEEVAPVAVSDAKLLAPEEIREHAKGDVIGKSERTRTDKNRERRKKKNKQRAIHKVQEERMLEKQKLGIKLTDKEEKNKLLKSVMKSKHVQKASTSTDGPSLKSSKAFFSQLQDKVTVKAGKERKRNPPVDSLSAKRLKL